MNNQASPLFRFAAIADIQYADIDDAMNFTQTETRGYRDSALHCASTVQTWKALQPMPQFIVQLGDLIDGQNSGTYGQGLQLSKPQTHTAFQHIIDLLQQMQRPIYHCVGNHEKYNFTWYTLARTLQAAHKEISTHQQIQMQSTDSSSVHDSSVASHHNIQAPFYCDFVMHAGWRGMILNPYQVSLLQEEESKGYQQAHAWLSKKNPTVLDPEKKSNYFKYVEGLDQRFVPFNGGFGPTQLDWIQACLQDAVQQDQKIMIFSHLPLSAAASNEQNIAYDYDQVLHLIQMYAPQHVKVIFAGHYHNGGYAQDEHGIHHVTLQSPLTHGYCATYIDVYDHKVEVVGLGAHRSYVLNF